LFRQAVYYIGRLLQLAAMWMLAVDVVTAGPLGPEPQPFMWGVAIFIGGWALARFAH
jgi:hypothetical protein